MLFFYILIFLQHDLFTGSDPEKFDLDIHLTTFFEGFDPAFEFRGFVVENVRSALTAYSPWVYETRIVENKSLIYNIIDDLWYEFIYSK